MYIQNSSPYHRRPLAPGDAQTLGPESTDAVDRLLAIRDDHAPTPLHALPGLARELGLGSLHLKDEGYRLGLQSFKALGGAYALMKLVQEEAAKQLGREIAVEELTSEGVRAIARGMTFACATDGNHGRSVAQGAQFMDANAVILVHAGVSAGRVEAIARFGARIIRVDGNYDDSVAEATRVAGEKGWIVLSDTAWAGYERIPGLVMQGYTAIAREALARLPEVPTHVFLQAGVGGFAAAIAGHLALVLGEMRPHVTVVEPARAACVFESARAGRPLKIEESQPTVMAMLECLEPSTVAYRVLERVADGFMTVEEADATDVMKRLADPAESDPPVVAGESGGAGLAGLTAALRDPVLAREIGLGPEARVLVVNTEGATDPKVYESIVGRGPGQVLEGRGRQGEQERTAVQR